MAQSPYFSHLSQRFITARIDSRLTTEPVVQSIRKTPQLERTVANVRPHEQGLEERHAIVAAMSFAYE